MKQMMLVLNVIILLLIFGCVSKKPITSFDYIEVSKKSPSKQIEDYFDYYHQKRFTEQSLEQYEKIITSIHFTKKDLIFYRMGKFKVKKGMSKKKALEAFGDPFEKLIIETKIGKIEELLFGFEYKGKKKYFGVINIMNGKVYSWDTSNNSFPAGEQYK